MKTVLGIECWEDGDLANFCGNLKNVLDVRFLFA